MISYAASARKLMSTRNDYFVPIKQKPIDEAPCNADPLLQLFFFNFLKSGSRCLISGIGDRDVLLFVQVVVTSMLRRYHSALLYTL